jgi:hypothetical protein
VSLRQQPGSKAAPETGALPPTFPDHLAGTGDHLAHPGHHLVRPGHRGVRPLLRFSDVLTQVAEVEQG